jgi:tetratricopeptide (TPR) repeat protein
MRPKNRYIILMLLIFPCAINAQDTITYKTVDSLTYKYYLSGDWNKLIQLGNKAIGNNIDYKLLRQRLGYAYYSLGRSFKAVRQFQKALDFDRYDQFTLEYLYYSYLNAGKEDWAGALTEKMENSLKNKTVGPSFKLIESIEIEYNFKYAATLYRSNPQYFRVGIESRLGYRLSVFESFSSYSQVISIKHPAFIEKIYDRQPEYYLLLKWNPTPNLVIKSGYHFLFSASNPANSGNLGYFAISTDFNRFRMQASGSVMEIEKTTAYQGGLQLGYTFPGRSDFYLSGTFSGLSSENKQRLIYYQRAGLKLGRKTWIEGNATLGKMDNSNDFDGMYVYYSYDPLSFRSGVTLFRYITSKVMIWFNYSYEQKDYFINNAYHYNQFSYLGGIKWKL